MKSVGERSRTSVDSYLIESVMRMEGVAKVFVINLRRRPDRLDDFFKRCPYKDVTVVEAVDGFDPNTFSLSPSVGPSTNQLYLRYRGIQSVSPSARKMRHGEFGCMASHVAVYAMMVEQGIPHAVIFEDDVFFTENFATVIWPKLLSAMGNSAPTGPTGILYIGGRFDDNARLPAFRESGMSDSLVFHDFDKGTWDWWQEDRTTHAYVITLEMAKRLLGHFLEGDGTTLPLDHALFQFFKRTATPPLNAQPLVCYCPTGYESDIQGKSDHIPL